jgi:multidrug efflux pump subunit AcrA (membrane-fusion protein)
MMNYSGCVGVENMSEENLNNIDDKRPKEVAEAEENEDAGNAEVDEIETSSNKRIFIALGVFVVAALLIGAYVYFRNPAPAAESETEKKEEVVVSVKVEKAEKGPIAKEVSAIGTIAPVEQSTVSASISAQITQMRLLKNEFVQKGEVLAVLASKDLQAQRNEAQAALDEAKLNLETVQKVTIPQTAAQAEKELSDAKATVDNKRAVYERRKDLYAKGGLSLKELEASKLELTNAENAYRLAQKNADLNKTAANPNARAIAQSKIKQAQDHLSVLDAQAKLAEVRSPISGIVTDQFQFEGEFAASGAKLLTIADLGEVFVKAQFADSVVADLKVGDSVTVHPADAPDQQLSGKVTLISRSADPQNRTVEVWARFGNPRGLLKVNGSAQFVVSSEPAEDAVVIPLSAVTLDASNTDEGTVMTVDEESVAHETKVKIGIKQGGKVQILEGLEGGETVVTEGNYALPDGSKVEIAKDKEEGEKEGGEEK